jgi:hypothetical protein
MMRAILLCLMLTGCASFDPAPTPKLIRSKAFVHLELVDVVTMPGHEKAAGVTLCTTTGICHIQIRRDHYPRCLEHESRHVFEGPWHGVVPTRCE